MKLSACFITLAMAATFASARVVAPDIHGPFSRENLAVREVNDINARNTEKIQGGAPDTRSVDDINARNTEEIQGGAPDTRGISLRGCNFRSCL